MTFPILTVCSYNRARSVMAELLLARATAGMDIAVSGAGFNSEGEPPLAATIAALRRYDLDAIDYRSTRLTPAAAAAAGLVLTAERMHVIRIVGDQPDLLRRTWTFPEFVLAAEAHGPREDQDLAAWVDAVGRDRTHASFLARPIPEIADPAGRPDAAFRDTAAMIDDLARRLAALL